MVEQERSENLESAFTTFSLGPQPVHRKLKLTRVQTTGCRAVLSRRVILAKSSFWTGGVGWGYLIEKCRWGGGGVPRFVSYYRNWNIPLWFAPFGYVQTQLLF